MIINGQSLLNLAPIKNMEVSKRKQHGVSYGLSEAGYDIRIKQKISFTKNKETNSFWICSSFLERKTLTEGRFALASAIEEFQMPSMLVGVVHDKSTWARKGLSVFNTVIEPGWNGFLTLELVYHGNDELIIPAGSGIAQVLFHEVIQDSFYSGKYQNQADKPVAAIESK